MGDLQSANIVVDLRLGRFLSWSATFFFSISAASTPVVSAVLETPRVQGAAEGGCLLGVVAGLLVASSWGLSPVVILPLMAVEGGASCLPSCGGRAASSSRSSGLVPSDLVFPAALRLLASSISLFASFLPASAVS